MRKWILIILVLALSMGSVSISSAGDRAVGGLYLGAGSGALIGQAIGRNTEATLLGTAIGGVLGYIIGNEQEKAYAYTREPVYTSTCREAEILGTVDGEPGRIRTVVCRDAYGRWVVDPNRQVVRTRTVIYREPTPVYYSEPFPVFLNLNFGWLFHDGRDHGWRGYHRGYRPYGHSWRGHERGWRGDNHGRGYRHRR